ncbi:MULTISPECIES: EAL domain-containing protein [unclassified Hydrogenobaculum]|uniref:bifunctional diguanylate cyclase/phosphodiesterase n=1 Tax=unclassified Hydrogenobaculum TaxID=2622382 RepID=UPI00020CCD26|nr:MULTISPECIES: EAL domain-containing protein [unclassified Hydrogenobaculum]AEF19761.1 diguanylate cyclase/phosphodiesterase with PAS/PAC sensor(s) [Hydrogenobaculum sp. 3684]AEG47048.1 diguanylate cyclase/phosphodiesterase with PAS/PAC sensor(s) [Hydrogenobaculum sp. SHO]AGG15696.1 diguanylate cyclase/phosphodiesterase with PAS/PAC sensor(s) [Hydrogenobaculum sp. HO]AGH93995.1 PAS domain S-box/diguanylate cyclase (GGDEF) domain-containing protein [Hydrogenobaculum sp. SN]
MKNKSKFFFFVLAFIFITFGLGLNLFYISKYKKDAIEYTKADLRNNLYTLKHHIANQNKLEYYLMKNIRYIITKSDMHRASYILQKNFDNDNSLFLIIDKNLKVVGKGYKEDELSIYEDAISNQNIKNAIYKCISSHKYCFTPAFKIDKHYFIFTLLPIKDSLYLLQIHKPPLYIYASSTTGFSYGVLLPNGVINAHIPILSKSRIHKPLYYFITSHKNLSFALVRYKSPIDGEPKLAAITRLDLVVGKVIYPYVSASIPFVLKGYYTNLRAVFLSWFIFGVVILGFIAFIIKKTKNEYLLNQEKYFYEVLFDKYSLPLLLIDENGKILKANEPASKLYGYSKEEIQNMYIYELEGGPKEESERLLTNIIQGDLKRFEFIHVSKSGKKINVEVYVNKLSMEDKTYILYTVFDISEKVLLAKLFDMLKKINTILVSVELESELLSGIAETIIMFDFDYVEIFKVKQKDNLELMLKSGTPIEDISLEEEKRALLSKSIALQSKPTYSKASTPILSHNENEVVYIISIYKKEFQFFDNYHIVSILEELEKDVSFALKKILEEQNSLILRKAVENSKGWVLITDEDGYILYANQTVCKISLYSCEEVIGRKPSIFKSGYHDDTFYKRLWDTIKSGDIFEGIFYNKAKNGDIFVLEEMIIPVKLKDGTVRYITIAKDITKEIELQERLERFRLIDDLTGLLNMAGFSKAINDRISYLKSSKTSDKGAVLLIDIYGFSELNQIHGFSHMDKLLKDFANMLNSVSKSQFGDDVVLSRVGPDEFGMFVECSQEDITSKINDFINKINELLVSKELGIDIFINIGVSFYDKDGDSFEVLREKANIALQEAKKEGPGTYRFYNEDISSSLKKYKEAQELLERALDKGLFKFFYQPYFDIKTKDFVGFEALMRIIDEDGSAISPYKFIDYLESSSYFLNRFQEVFLKMVEKDMNTFISKAKSHFSSAFNISANSFKDDMFMSKLIGLCHEFEDKLVIEITERMLLSDFEKAKEILRNIRSVGSKVALDDFGTYYSSLSYIKNIELDIIKIDISFVKDIVFDKRSLAVVKAIINLAKALNIKTIAEGVENEEQYELLKEIGCDIAQGYLFAKPMPLEEAIKYII